MTPSKILFFSCVAFIIGIAVQSVVKIPQIYIWGILLLGVLAIATSFFKKKEATVIGFCLLFFIMGITRLDMAELAFSQDALLPLNDNPEKITLIGTIISEPVIKDSSQVIKFKDSKTGSIVLVTLAPYPEYHYLDTLQITGKLKSPPEFTYFNYKNYLLKDGIYSLMGFPKATLVSGDRQYNTLSFAYEKILTFKKLLKNSINHYFSPPYSSILEGIILGSDASMPKETREKLNATGLSHLTAISGSNIVILSSILMIFLLAIGLWRGQAFYLAVTFIWLYIVITGFPASGVRAAIMASVFLLAQKLGRQNTNSRIIIFTAALMLLQNPMLLLYDVGFQLSFLAALGIIYIKPLIDWTYRNILLLRVNQQKEAAAKEDNHGLFLDIFSITIAAQIATFPIIAYNFKTISLVAVATNLLVIPVVDFIMIGGFIAAFLGIFSNMLGFIVSIPVWVLLHYFIKIVDIFYQPWAVASLQHFSWIWIFAFYLGLSLLVKYLSQFLQPRFLGY